MSSTAKPLPHPGRTPAQRRVLDEIGCGNHSPIMAPRTRDALLDAGLIVEIAPRVLSGDRLGPITITQYEMPVSVHMQWCSAVGGCDLPDDFQRFSMTSADRIIRLKEVVARCGLHRATIYRRMDAGTFPKAFPLGANSIGWYERDFDAWLADPAGYGTKAA